MLAVEGSVQLMNEHIARLQKGLTDLRSDIPGYFNKKFIADEVYKAIACNEKHQYQRVRIQLTTNEFSFIVEVSPLSPEVPAYNEMGLKLCLADDLQVESNMANLKRLDPSFYKKAAEFAKANDCVDVLLLKNNEIIESGVANIFWVKDGVAYTPPLSSGCVAGVMRQYLLQTSSAIQIKEKTLTFDELMKADEVFLTNALRRIKWVETIRDRRYSGRISRKLHQTLFD